MKIVILDGYTENPGDLSWKPLEELGELTVYDRTPFDEKEIIRRIGGAEVVFTNKTPLSASTLKACPSIRFISVLATGYNVVDYVCARRSLWLRIWTTWKWQRVWISVPLLIRRRWLLVTSTK